MDDGLASGYTMKASVYMAAKRHAARKVVAVPTAPRNTIDALQDSVDEIYCPNIRQGFPFAVADAYRKWRDISEAQAIAMLKEASFKIPPSDPPGGAGHSRY